MHVYIYNIIYDDNNDDDDDDDDDGPNEFGSVPWSSVWGVKGWRK